MALKIPYKYDIGQIIAPIKQSDPKLWQALNDLNTATRTLNTIVGNDQALCLYERIQFEIGDASVNLGRYVVRIPVDATNNPIGTQLILSQLIISSNNIPAGDDVVDISVSNDRGVTWRTILKDTSDPDVTYDKATLVAGQTLMTYGSPQFATNTFNSNDMLKIDFISGATSDGIQVSLVGAYVL